MAIGRRHVVHATVSGKKRDVRKPAEAKKKVNSQAAVGYVDRKSSRAIL
jgi:hypothetical protein